MVEHCSRNTKIAKDADRRGRIAKDADRRGQFERHIEGAFGSCHKTTNHGSKVRSRHRINAQPEVRLRVGAFDVGVLVFSAAAIFLASVHEKCLRYTEDVDVVFTKKNSSLLTLERGR